MNALFMGSTSVFMLDCPVTSVVGKTIFAAQNAAIHPEADQKNTSVEF